MDAGEQPIAADKLAFAAAEAENTRMVNELSIVVADQAKIQSNIDETLLSWQVSQGQHWAHVQFLEFAESFLQLDHGAMQARARGWSG